MPEYSATSIRPEQKLELEKKNNESIFCTCSKSGCNKKYCECYKNKVKCTKLCRCIKCENRNMPQVEMPKIYKCCHANSIYIIGNKLTVENSEIKKVIKNNKKHKILNKKTKRDNKKNTGSLFDKDGKMIFTHIKL